MVLAAIDQNNPVSSRQSVCYRYARRVDFENNEVAQPRLKAWGIKIVLQDSLMRNATHATLTKKPKSVTAILAIVLLRNGIITFFFEGFRDDLGLDPYLKVQLL